jgi:mono/diheme cytochrome c family protein
MRIRLGSAVLMGCSLLAAQTVPKVKKTSVTATSPAVGKDMYVQYCAACHGKDGKGGGPAAPALKAAPADLTRLTERNQGKFPDVRIARLIDGSDDLAAHGSRVMPVWGEVFHQMDGNGMSTTKMRVANLTAYLQSIQSIQGK